MFNLIGWLVYGLVVGLIARAIHPGEEKPGVLWTLVIGIAGSYVGGLMNWILGSGGGPFQGSGIIMGILGGVVFLWSIISSLRSSIVIISSYC